MIVGGPDGVRFVDISSHIIPPPLTDAASDDGSDNGGDGGGDGATSGGDDDEAYNSSVDGASVDGERLDQVWVGSAVGVAPVGGWVVRASAG